MEHIKIRESIINTKVIKEIEKCIELFGEKYMINVFQNNKLKGEKFSSQQEFNDFEYLDTLSFTDFFAILNKNYIAKESLEDVLSSEYASYIHKISLDDTRDDFVHKKNGFIRVCEVLQKHNVFLEFLPESNLEKKNVLIRQKLADAIDAYIKEYSIENLIYSFESHKLENKKFSSAVNPIYCNLIDLDKMDFNDFFKILNGHYEIIEELFDSLEVMYNYYNKNSNKTISAYERQGFMNACEIMKEYGYKLEFLSENN